jgi:tyrosyl-tRNA synthetase
MSPEAAAPTSLPDPRDQLALLTRNAAEVIPREELAAKLQRSATEGRPLRVKLGLDPTAAEVTLGWAVVLRKLREFQDLGHTAVLIVGDFTARVGDPSEKSETRPRLAKEAVQGYAERLLGQFSRVVSQGNLEVRYNSEWLEKMDMEAVLELTASYTVARMLERDDFAKRYAEGRPISIMEFLYPLLQAMDSVAVRADVELGGTDQKFNLLVGREIQRHYEQDPQVVFTMPLLEGLDGVQKMSQSLGNYVGITEPPSEMFGKLMRIPDELIVKYLRLCTALPSAEIERIERGLADGSRHPNMEKRRMARAVVELYHGAEAADAAEQQFDRVHKQRYLPDDVPNVAVNRSAVIVEKEPGVVFVSYPALLVELGLAQSRSDARRLMEQGGVRRDGHVWTQVEERLTGPIDAHLGSVWQVGRRKFARLAGFD